jgi:carbon monoxide dehydrogenase subunit G
VPADTFTHTTAASASPTSIWEALQDPETWKGIGPIDDVWAAQHGPDGALTGFSWRAHAAGRAWEGTATRSPLAATDSMTLNLDSAEIDGTITVDIAGTGSTSVLTVTMHARSKGFLAGMFWGVIATAMRTGLAAQVDRFGEQF